ncbi:MAG: 2-dehydro-3-deoxygalactonokinase [Paludibacterium sp.]|uniref:2-dehydro-3-deoxygalactonokinase n=1 Tax=Paludibacterium sp. TaxID=1917523 RepID=UPI0025D055E0|nr:2-dehydro-3-deoxygalactonokinase [Paludibacterium sp.]MBV8046697.1 2-dehydro-3-deoxygalactonokinase [Paludibacterium sp.]MBV8647298.1 2-dehydro-3-deoxygalactonokinase [Paludibacterium sp.]
MSPAALIGVDWGSSNARAFLFGRDGSRLAERAAAIGIARHQGEACAGVLADWLRDWLDDYPGVPLLLCGMVGSRNGWRECAYLPTPAAPALLAGSLHAFDWRGRGVAIVPGVCHDNPLDGFSDVMRGEETQIAGLPAVCPQFDQLDWLLMPGTHCKWIRLRQGGIVELATYMTGEMYALLRQHSLLSGLIDDGGAWRVEPFLQGVEAAVAHPDWLHQLFGVRARGVRDAMPPDALAGWLSGLLIGYEIQAALARPADAPAKLCGIVGAPRLARCYAAALRHFSIETVAIDGDQAVAAGLWSLARQAGWV